jgi:hypothetical protein
MDNNQTTVSEWLAQAGKVAGHDLALGAEGHCTIGFADGMQCMVEVAQDSELVFMYVPLMRLPEEAEQQALLLKFVLELNLFGLQTAGAVLAYDQRTDHVLLTFSARIDQLDAVMFGRALGDMLDVAVMLNDNLAQFEQRQQSLPTTSAAFSGDAIRV